MANHIVESVRVTCAQSVRHSTSALLCSFAQMTIIGHVLAALLGRVLSLDPFVVRCDEAFQSNDLIEIKFSGSEAYLQIGMLYSKREILKLSIPGSFDIWGSLTF